MSEITPSEKTCSDDESHVMLALRMMSDGCSDDAIHAKLIEMGAERYRAIAIVSGLHIQLSETWPDRPDNRRRVHSSDASGGNGLMFLGGISCMFVACWVASFILGILLQILEQIPLIGGIASALSEQMLTGLVGMAAAGICSSAGSPGLTIGCWLGWLAYIGTFLASID